MDEKIKEFEEKPNTNGNLDALKSRIFLSILIAWVIGLVPFTGYGYLRGYLSALGFESPIISATPHDLVYFCLEAFAVAINFSGNWFVKAFLEIYIIFSIVIFILMAEKNILKTGKRILILETGLKIKLRGVLNL
tara:strand:+ start:353 stop:757 length:405 start_codon:yes stop_codon:yes gene_type:complete